MSRSTFTVLRCDRCGFEAKSEGGETLPGWGRVFAEATSLDGDALRRIGAGQEACDLCGGCSQALSEYWERVGEVEQPAPPPPPPAPIYKLDDRARAITLVSAALKTRIDLAIAAVREEPTAMLSGDVIAGAYVDLDASAAGMVDGIADMLKLKKMRA